MNPEAGTYALILRSQSTIETQVGRWGSLTIKPGYYIYVGSAFGPGGVKARVLRHCRKTKGKHWHIDYLRECVVPVGTWYSYGPEHLEHKWAQSLYAMDDIEPIKGFGCSDCTCFSHLFTSARKPAIEQFVAIVGGSVESWLYRKNGK